MQQLTFILLDEESTLAFGRAFGLMLIKLSNSQLRLNVNLLGDLGAGKTTLVRGVLRGLGFSGRVKSPTYPLLETYNVGSIHLVHFDLYRLETPNSFSEAGFEEYFLGEGVRFVEWPDRAGSYLPTSDLCIAITDGADQGRVLKIEVKTPSGKAAIDQLTP